MGGVAPLFPQDLLARASAAEGIAARLGHNASRLFLCDRVGADLWLSPATLLEELRCFNHHHVNSDPILNRRCWMETSMQCEVQPTSNGWVQSMTSTVQSRRAARTCWAQEAPSRRWAWRRQRGWTWAPSWASQAAPLSLSSLPASDGGASAGGGATAVAGRSADRGLRFSRGREPPAAAEDGALLPPPHRLSDVSAGKERLKLVRRRSGLSRCIACMLGGRHACLIARSSRKTPPVIDSLMAMQTNSVTRRVAMPLLDGQSSANMAEK